jgi:hypothetical protein
MGSVIGPIVLLVVMLVLFPPLVLMSGGIASALLGFLLQKDRDEVYEGTEFIDIA